MFGFFRRLLSGVSSQHVIKSYWCESAIKLPTEVRTPLGGRVRLITVCVDIFYVVEHDEIVVRRVRMAAGGGMIGSRVAVNVASERRGEAWHSSDICDEATLARAVHDDLSRDGSRLRRIMLGKHPASNRDALANSIADALNAKAAPERISALLPTGGRAEIVFLYSKPDGNTTRRVTVVGVSGDSIRAVDHKDNKLKSFLIDRISKARKA